MLIERAWIEIRTEKPQALEPVFVDEPVDRARQRLSIHVHFTCRLAGAPVTGKEGALGDIARLSALAVFDLETRAERPVVSDGDHVTAATLDPTGRFIVTGTGDGLVRVSPLDESEEPHLLYVFQQE